MHIHSCEQLYICIVYMHMLYIYIKSPHNHSIIKYGKLGISRGKGRTVLFSEYRPFNTGVVPRCIRRSHTESFVNIIASLWILKFWEILAQLTISGDPQIQSLKEKKKHLPQDTLDSLKPNFVEIGQKISNLKLRELKCSIRGILVEF